jgi:hypothetical protein
MPVLQTFSVCFVLKKKNEATANVTQAHKSSHFAKTQNEATATFPLRRCWHRRGLGACFCGPADPMMGRFIDAREDGGVDLD